MKVDANRVGPIEAGRQRESLAEATVLARSGNEDPLAVDTGAHRVAETELVQVDGERHLLLRVLSTHRRVFQPGHGGERNEFTLDVGARWLVHQFGDAGARDLVETRPKLLTRS